MLRFFDAGVLENPIQESGTDVSLGMDRNRDDVEGFQNCRWLPLPALSSSKPCSLSRRMSSAHVTSPSSNHTLGYVKASELGFGQS